MGKYFFTLRNIREKRGVSKQMRLVPERAEGTGGRTRNILQFLLSFKPGKRHKTVAYISTFLSLKTFNLVINWLPQTYTHTNVGKTILTILKKYESKREFKNPNFPNF